MSETDFQGQASTGSGKSESEVAFELLSKLKGQGVWGERNKSAILDMYAECLDAAKGLRPYEGQRRIDVPIQQMPMQSTPHQASRPAATNIQQPQAMPQAAQPQSAAPMQAAPQPQTLTQPQPVHVQQQAVAQAYKPAG
jgi:microcystin-dependent protein